MIPGMMELAIVILLATVLGMVARFLKQPLILAFILAGALITYFGFFHLNQGDMLKVFSELGIMFLLFLIGLEINYTSLKQVGKISLLVGLGQIIFTSLFGFIIARLLNFEALTSLYIAVTLTFSSTIIVMKILSEKKELRSLYGKISIGFLLVQDFVAILILVFLASIQTEGMSILPLIITVAKGIVLFFLMLWLGRKIMPKIFDIIAHSQELLFLSSIAWVFLMVTAVNKLGFSIEIGGFMAGLALANSSEHFQIASRIKPLRDFFILIFFVILGSSLVMADFSGLIIPAIILSIFVLIGNPLIVLIIMGLMGYRKKTGFMCGVTVAQISEFSLVVAAVGLKVGHITESIVSLITIVGVITITLSVYLMTYSEKIYLKLRPLLFIFERKKLKETYLETSDSKPVILIGSHRLGQSISYSIPKKDLLIIDFDPQVIEEVKRAGYAYLFGDPSDEEVFDRANFQDAKLIISTVPDFSDNLSLLQKLNSLKKSGSNFKIIVRGVDEKETADLYRAGADYVIFPHFTSGQYLGKSIHIDPELKILGELREKDLGVLRKLESRK